MTFIGIYLNLLNVLLGIFLVGPEGGMSLEMMPSASKVLLGSLTNYTVVCSGWSEVKWRLPQDYSADGVFVDSQGSSSILMLVNVTWQNSGRFTCEEASSDQSRDIDIFIPGEGPDEWFTPSGPGVVMKETEEDTIPCKVSDPHLSVSLYELGRKTPVDGMTYEPGHGFTGRLNDTSYVCIASKGTQEKTSQTYYVFSIIVPKVMEVDLSVSSQVLKRGEVLTVNCTVKDTDMFFFTWDFPRRQEIEPLMEFLPNQIRSFVNITSATAADSGVYVCTVQETKEGRMVKKNVTVTVLDRGYVYLWTSGETNVSSLLHHTVEFSVEIDAHPPPSVLWTKDNQTISTETNSITTKHLTGSRYVTTLTLVRAQMDQTGSYSANVMNEDDQDQVIFLLEVKAPPRITSLSEVSSNTVLCVSEGVPPPTVTWYTCPSTDRCSGLNIGWRNLTDASEGVTLQNTVIQAEGGMAKVQSVLTLQGLTSLSAVRCEVRNPAGGRARDLRVVSSSLLSQVSVLVVVLVLVVIAVVFFIILIIVWRKKPRYEVRWKVIESVSPDGQEYTYLDPAHLPYSSSWEVQRDHVVLGDVLGSGAFGRVVEATVSGLINSQSKTRAAVKMVKERSSAVHSLVSELKVLVHLGPHLNVVNLLGACTRGGPVYLITEFCPHGDLVNYLQKNKHTFPQGINQNHSDGDGGYMDMNKEDSVQYEAMKELNYAEIEPAVYETPEVAPDHQEVPEVLLSESPLLSPHDLLSFSYQVCQAMDFLSSKQCVHRDLAARNVLVCDGKLVKVGDFGLARDMLKDQDYVARGNTFLPLKWMSPESIFQNVYSSQSDVWSYGVLLWEIFSLGCSPYSDLPMTQQFCSALKRGYRMERPQHAPTHMYDLMKRCWESSPQSRPSFSSLVVSVGDMLSDDFKQRYVKLTEDFMKGENPVMLRSRQSSSRTEDHTHEDRPVSVNVGSESVELSPSHGSYVIPSTDITIETSGEAALDVASPLISNSSEDSLTSPPRGEDESCL